jgi:hypothetical protein
LFQGLKSNFCDAGVLLRGLEYPLLLPLWRRFISLSQALRTREGEIMVLHMGTVCEEVVCCLEFFDLILILLQQPLIVFFCFQFILYELDDIYHSLVFSFEEGMNIFTLFWSSCLFEEV